MPNKAKQNKSKQSDQDEQNVDEKSVNQADMPEYTRDDKSATEINLDVTAPTDQFEKVYDSELKKLAKEVDIKGFRKGKAPLEMVEKSKGREALENTLRVLMPKLTVMVLQEEDLQPVIPITYEVLSIEDKDNIKFRAKVVLLPEFDVPNLDKVEIEKESTDVEDKEIESVIKRLWEEHRGDAKNKDDAWVKQISPKLGLEASNMEELKKKLRKSVKMEKERIAAQNYGNQALQKAIELADLEVPQGAVDFEMAERERSFKQQLEQMDATVEQFCKIRGLSEEELKKQWRKDSRKALENDVFLSKYADEREIEVTKDELKEEIEKIKQRSPEKADEKTFQNPQWRSYVRRVVLKRKAYQAFLDEVGVELPKRPSPQVKKAKGRAKKGKENKNQDKKSKLIT
jgi:FKBP-type peptidyl-prolyl cis-trans isomerase (trigger factor)